MVSLTQQSPISEIGDMGENTSQIRVSVTKKKNLKNIVTLISLKQILPIGQTSKLREKATNFHYTDIDSNMEVQMVWLSACRRLGNTNQTREYALFCSWLSDFCQLTR